MIDIDDVHVSFGETTVFDSFSTDVAEGRFVGVVGPNGAGKTTLLRTISGAVTPDAGVVRIDGVDVTDRTSKEHSRLVSMVPQESPLAFSFAVRHFVELGRTPYRSRFSPPDDRDRLLVDDALERTETAQFQGRYVDELSGGQRRRVVLARALAQDTPVVLLDEPTASLDVNHQVEVLSLVASLVDSGKTVVAAIHDLDLATRFCDELLVLSDGQLVERGSPEDVVTTDTIETAFDATGVVSPNPITWTPTVTTLPSGFDRPPIPDRVHVVGTGPRTATVLSTLAATDSTITLGPVPAGDAAATTAAQLGLQYDAVPPLSDLEDPAVRSLERSMQASDATVAVIGGPLDSREAVWEPLLVVPSVVVTPTDGPIESSSGSDSPKNVAESLDRLRSHSVEASARDLVAALATLDRGKTTDSRTDRIDGEQ